jgi:hypothetical protein
MENHGVSLISNVLNVETLVMFLQMRHTHIIGMVMNLNAPECKLQGGVQADEDGSYALWDW